MTLAKFSLIYLIFPFAVVMMLLFAILDQRIRAYAGDVKWVIMIALGLAYFCNFTRSLVRHSLVESETKNLCIWTGVLFIAWFWSLIRKNHKLLLPVFSFCMVIYSAFWTEESFRETSVLDQAAVKIGNYTETWTPDRFAEESGSGSTYWKKLSDHREKIERVRWNQGASETIQKYQTVIDAILEENETFADCINKTSLYPLIGRQNPAYVSQSPWQLSGEFAQERFTEEIAGVPVVLMPYDFNKDDHTHKLDLISNFYRHYKVFEYIYQNYVPLCTYENEYAVWCLPERYDEMVSKLIGAGLVMNEGTDVGGMIALSDKLERHHMDTTFNEDGTPSLCATGKDPYITNIETLTDLSLYLDQEITIAVDYATDVLGNMQLFYTTEPDENFSEEKSLSTTLQCSKGTAYFRIPITRYTHLRMDIPEQSTVMISGFRIGACSCQLIDYGYDGPDVDGGVFYEYVPYAHSYTVNKLPLIWGENDRKDSSQNRNLCELRCAENVWKYDFDGEEYGAEGNYLKVVLEYDGKDTAGMVESDDEYARATLSIGKMADGQFEKEYRYIFDVQEGKHTYLFRVSNDYYWYRHDAGAVTLESNEPVQTIRMEILEGD